MTKITSIINNTLSYLNKLRGQHTLTIRGFLVCNTDKNSATEQKFDWKNAIIDATITCAVTFFSTLGAVHATGLNNSGVTTATVSALTQFFVFLALKRGIVNQKEN